jgi:hypothetical protein
VRRVVLVIQYSILILVIIVNCVNIFFSRRLALVASRGSGHLQVPEIRYPKELISFNTVTVPQYSLLYALLQYGQRIDIPYLLSVRHYSPVVS